MVKDENLSPAEMIQKLEMQFYDEFMDGKDDEYESPGFDDAKSFIGSEILKIVPKESVKILQNKKLIDIWHETKKQHDVLIRSQELMTTAEIDKSSEAPQLCKFFKEQNRALDRFIKVMCTEEDNLVSALIID